MSNLYLSREVKLHVNSVGSFAPNILVFPILLFTIMDYYGAP